MSLELINDLDHLGIDKMTGNICKVV